MPTISRDELNTFVLLEKGLRSTAVDLIRDRHVGRIQASSGIGAAINFYLQNLQFCAVAQLVEGIQDLTPLRLGEVDQVTSTDPHIDRSGPAELAVHIRAVDGHVSDFTAAGTRPKHHPIGFTLDLLGPRTQPAGP